MPFLFIPQHPGIDENQPGNTSSHYSAAHIFDSYSKEELQSVHKFNASILAQKKDSMWPPSKYLMQIMNEQTEIEFRLERMEQETRNEGDKLDNQDMGDQPEFMLATKYKVMISPVRTRTHNGSRVASISMEEAARLERRAKEAQTPQKTRPEPPVIHNGMTEQEKHERIIAFMSYQASDDDDDDETYGDDDDDTMELDGPARGGEYIDTDDLSQFIRVDPDIIPRGGRYFNGVGDC